MNALPSPPSQPNAGIATGNPQPLPTQQPKQQPQQFDLSKYPDLATALHAMKVVQDEKAKQVQQGLQAGQQAQGQPPVIQQINAALQQIAAERAPRPQMLPSGVDHLTSNLGESYAGGGIVAFAGGGKPDTTDAKGDPYWPSDDKPEDMPYGEQMANALGFPWEVFKRLVGAPNQRQYEVPKKVPAPAPMPEPIVAEGEASGRLPSRGIATPAAAPSPDASRTTYTVDGGSGVSRSSSSSTPGKYNPEEFTTELQGEILKGMRADPRKQADEDTETARKLMGLEPILAEQRKRAAATQALMNQQRDVRSPMQQWLSGFANAAPGKGLGLAAAHAGDVYDTAQQGWAKEDLTNNLTVNKMLDDIDKAQIAGNEQLVKSRTQALGDYIREKGVNVTAGAQESSRIEAAKLRMQQAKDAAAGRSDQKVLAILQMGINQAAQDADRQTREAAQAYAKTIEGQTGAPFDTDAFYKAAYAKSINENEAAQYAKRVLGIKSAPVATPAPAPKIDLSQWGQPKAK
jgi:hypothetical protein